MLSHGADILQPQHIWAVRAETGSFGPGMTHWPALLHCGVIV